MPVINKSDWIDEAFEKLHPELNATRVRSIKEMREIMGRGEPPNDPSSPTAEPNAQSAPEAESAVRCSAWLGDVTAKTRSIIGEAMRPFVTPYLEPKTINTELENSGKT